MCCGSLGREAVRAKWDDAKKQRGSLPIYFLYDRLRRRRRRHNPDLKVGHLILLSAEGGVTARHMQPHHAWTAETLCAQAAAVELLLLLRQLNSCVRGGRHDDWANGIPHLQTLIDGTTNAIVAGGHVAAAMWEQLVAVPGSCIWQPRAAAVAVAVAFPHVMHQLAWSMEGNQPLTVMKMWNKSPQSNSHY
jgi:hypothetical protein